MPQYHQLIVTVLVIHSTHAALALVEYQKEPALTFAESVYAKASGACRAIMQLRHQNVEPSSDIIKSMKIIHIDGTTVRTFSIDEAFYSLTSLSLFDITKQTKIIIHGFKDNSQSEIPLDLARAYDEKAMFNVLMVDAENYINKGYLISIQNSRTISKRLANLLAKLENYGTNAEDIHLLGISLGAHIAGWAGKYFRYFTGNKIGRITGLDPAGPCFSLANPDQRLDKDDAIYVDVVHSNRLIQGAIESLGDADFYLNGGGPNQPGCFSSRCSHVRAAIVYAESVRAPTSFVGVRCDSWKQFESIDCNKTDYSVLGYGSSISSQGTYHLRTRSNAPYGLGMDGTQPSTLLNNFIGNFYIT